MENIPIVPMPPFHIWTCAVSQLQLQMCMLNPHFHTCLMLSVTTDWHCFRYWSPRRFTTLHMNHINLSRSPATGEEVCVEGPDGIYSRHWHQMDLSQIELQALQNPGTMHLIMCESVRAIYQSLPKLEEDYSSSAAGRVHKQRDVCADVLTCA